MDVEGPHEGSTYKVDIINMVENLLMFCQY